MDSADQERRHTQVSVTSHFSANDATALPDFLVQRFADTP